MLVVIRGAGDLASGIALRLLRSGLQVVMTDLPKPLAIRRSVAFCEAIRLGQVTVEGVTARFAPDTEAARQLLKEGILPVLADPERPASPLCGLTRWWMPSLPSGIWAPGLPMPRWSSA